MPRQVSLTIATELDKPTPHHVRLLEIGFPGHTLRYSTHEQITWEDSLWHPLGVTIENVSATEATFALRNEDNSISALVLTLPLDEVPVRILDWYGGDAEQIHVGLLNGAPQIGNPVRLSSRGHRGAPMYPNERIAAPEFPHITPAGTVIRWGNDQLVLEVRGR